jgi:hypothetical protein
MRIVVTDGVTAKETIVQDVQITEANVDSDVVTGYAPPGAGLYLSSWNDSPVTRYFNANPDGSWSMDYRTPSVNGVTVDIVPGDGFTLSVRDEEFDSTFFEYFVPYPEMLIPGE